MRLQLYCTAACLAVLATAAGAAAQPAPPAQPTPGAAAFNVFYGGREVGREQVNLARSGSDWIITATSRIAAPLDVTARRFELKYSADWQPISLSLDATTRQGAIELETSFGLTTAVNEFTQNGVTNSKTDQVSARTVVLPNSFFAAYEGLAARLAGLAAGAQLPVYVAPQTEIKVVVNAVTRGVFQTPAGIVGVHRFSIVFHNPNGELPAEMSVDDGGRFARLEIASAGLLVIRQDLASVASRSLTSRNPTDVDVTIPATGFTLAGTLTTPPETAGRMRRPAVVLVPGFGAVDRDYVVAGVPLFAQLAGDLAGRGFVVLRYDKRGVGQSGGRLETVTMQEYAEDVIAAVKWLEKRRDVDKRRIAVVGHSEGGAVAMLAAARERKKISALVPMATMGTRGVDLVLEQQQYSLDMLKTPANERPTKVEIQKRILDAAMTGQGLDDLPPEVRARVDTPWYRSLLLFDPAETMERLRQPVLVLAGELDKQVPPHHAKQLAALVDQRKRGPDATLKVLPGLNHLFVPAKTGDISEYASLSDKRVSPDVAEAIAAWLAAPDAGTARASQIE